LSFGRFFVWNRKSKSFSRLGNKDSQTYYLGIEGSDSEGIPCFQGKKLCMLKASSVSDGGSSPQSQKGSAVLAQENEYPNLQLLGIKINS